MRAVIIACVFAIAFTQYIPSRLGAPVYETVAPAPVVSRPGVWPSPAYGAYPSYPAYPNYWPANYTAPRTNWTNATAPLRVAPAYAPVYSAPAYTAPVYAAPVVTAPTVVAAPTTVLAAPTTYIPEYGYSAPVTAWDPARNWGYVEPANLGYWRGY